MLTFALCSFTKKVIRESSSEGTCSNSKVFLVRFVAAFVFNGQPVEYTNPFVYCIINRNFCKKFIQ